MSNNNNRNDKYNTGDKGTIKNGSTDVRSQKEGQGAQGNPQSNTYSGNKGGQQQGQGQHKQGGQQGQGQQQGQQSQKGQAHAKYNNGNKNTDEGDGTY